MTITKTIEFARSYGLGSGYARVMSAAIRGASSTRSAAAFRKAIAEDKAEHLFLFLDSDVPVAA